MNLTEDAFMTSGRRSAFAPTKQVTRNAMGRGDVSSLRGIEPEVDREIATHAAALLKSIAFRSIMDRLAQKARDTFEKSAFGPVGDATRTIAHAQLAACREIQTQLQAMADDAKIHDRIEADRAEHD